MILEENYTFSHFLLFDGNFRKSLLEILLAEYNYIICSFYLFLVNSILKLMLAIKIVSFSFCLSYGFQPVRTALAGLPSHLSQWVPTSSFEVRRQIRERKSVLDKFKTFKVRKKELTHQYSNVNC